MPKSYTVGLMVLAASAAAAHAQVLTTPDRPGVETKVSGGAHTKIRALSVVEYSGDKPESGNFRVVPVTVFVGGSFKDGEAFLANPTPFTLSPGTIYEVQESGNPLGYVTVKRDGVSQTDPNADPIHYGIGTLDKKAPDEVIAKAAPAQVTINDSETLHYYDPTLKDKKHRRGKGKDKDKDKNADDKDDKNDKDAGKSGSDKDKQTTASTQGPRDDNDAPTLKKRKEQNQTQQQQDQASMTNGQPVLPGAVVDADPDRPRLSRGKPATVASAVPETVALNQNYHALVAVSDPNNKESHAFRYEFNAGDEQRYRNQMIKLAVSEAKVQKKTLPPPAQWKDIVVRGYTLTMDNAATMVLSATVPGNTPQYITLAARIDLEGELRRLFFQVTDASRFDIAPRMTLVDAVDADGDGRGELLFRVQSDQGTGWAIYRVTPDDLRKLFDTLPSA
ncbi:MAG TPA: hypothetical protein VGC88_08865 [Terriglobales bacterium]